MSREVGVEDELYRLICKLLEERGFTVEGVELRRPERLYPVASGHRVDLAIMLAERSEPLLIIETKRKYYEGERCEVVRDVMPTSSAFVNQALSYAILSGAPYFATTNGATFALMRTPERGEGFSLHRHIVWLKERVTINEELVEELLATTIRHYRGERVPTTPLDELLVIHLREFVRWLSSKVEPLIREKLRMNEEFRAKHERLAEEIGYRPDAAQLAREMAYVFMNKIVFYKILERSFEELSKYKLTPIAAPDVKAYLSALNRLFAKAVEVTGNFEPVFSTGIYDEIELPDEPIVLETINGFIEDMDRYRLEELGSDVIGHIYEELIPADERHALGQFYTPPPIAELIVRWAVRSPSDLVLDPGCGSGTFLVKAYNRLLELKGYAEPSEEVHREILSQLYAIDINPFPLHLTALNLASRYIRAPSTEMNVIQADFFRVRPEQKFVAPRVVKMPVGEVKREIVIPKLDAVVGNPPYTRWIEIPVKVRRAILESIGRTLAKYGLIGRPRSAEPPGMHVHFVIHSLNMLREGGRLGMIISDSWLQTDYGTRFGEFLLDHFKVKAVIDISARVFPVPLTGNCIVLLERCSNPRERDENSAVFMYLDVSSGRAFKVSEILEAIERPEKYANRDLVRVLRQGEVPRGEKWINLFFDVSAVLNELREKTIPLKALFEVSLGNSLWSTWSVKHGGRPDAGAKEFFYLDEGRVKQRGLEKYAYPALTSARHAKWFTFTREDWEDLRKRGSPCYFFICHEPRSSLPENVLEYIKWGETECRTTVRGTRGGGKVCSESVSCRTRERRRDLFYGWYDLGGVRAAPVMAIYQSRYKTRFILVKHPVVTYHAMLAFIPRVELSELQLKALLAYLNSSFSQLYIESAGRTTGAVGPIGLEMRHAEEMPVIDVRRLSQEDVELLASLFDELEAEARRLGGADRAESVERLWDTVVERIDMEVARVLGLSEGLARAAKLTAKAMMNRRLQRAKRAKTRAIESEEELPSRPSRELRGEPLVTLDNYLSRDRL